MARARKTEAEKAERRRKWREEYVAKNKERLKAYQKEYYEKNKEGSIKDYRDATVGKRLAYQRNYYYEHKEECHARIKAWRAKKRAEREKGEQGSGR